MIKPKYDGLYIGEKRISVYSGEVHYWRLDQNRWEKILSRVKEMGFATITTYIPWEVHEVEKNVFDFGDTDHRKDIDDFLTLCEEKRLKALVRPGPQINSELTWFGYPRRILENPEIQPGVLRIQKSCLLKFPDQFLL